MVYDMVKMSKEEFVKSVINSGNGGLQNDGTDIFANIEGTGMQVSVPVSEVYGIDYEESEPFEISSEIESDEEHVAWDYLYDSYTEQLEED